MAPFDDVSVTQMKPASKYYFAGSQRVAVRTGGVLNFLLSDQLGSTSVTLDVNGVNVGELRYSAFGETRKTFGSTPTDYRYTGQREEAGIGLYYYNARWYDSQLGRFVQADSIVPPGVQGLDRYAAMGNNPVRFTDPSGHKYCDNENPESCTRLSNSIEDTAIKYRVRLQGKWSNKDKLAVVEAVEMVGTKFAAARGIGENPSDAFKKVFKRMTFNKVYSFDYKGETYTGGCKTEATITCATIDYYYFQSTVNNIVHELGHAFDPGVNAPSVFINNRQTILRSNYIDYMWQSNDSKTPGETFGDFFVAWVNGVWGDDADIVWPGYQDIGSAKNWMNSNMQFWLKP